MHKIQPMSVSPRIIALWTAPRSISSAFERTFAQRPDTTPFFEPFFYTYYYSQWRMSDRLGDFEKKRSHSAEVAIQEIKSATSPLVFLKEMAFIYWPYLDRAFLEGIMNTFLLRPPKEALNGWLKQGDVPTEERFGYTILLKFWKYVREEIGQEVVVVKANEFRADPEMVLRKYCEKVGIPFLSDMLSWEKKEHKTWDNDLMNQGEEWKSWQSTLNTSTTILPPEKKEIVIPSKYDFLIHPAEEVYEEISQFAI